MTTEERKVLEHAMIYGAAYMVDGNVIDPKDIFKDDAILRAEKIAGLIVGGIKVHASYPKVLEQVAAEIREAVEEDRNTRTAQDLYQHSYERGKAEAYGDAVYLIKLAKAETYEDAAKIAEVNDGRIPGGEAEAEALNIASAIRARAAELRK